MSQEKTFVPEPKKEEKDQMLPIIPGGPSGAVTKTTSPVDMVNVKVHHKKSLVGGVSQVVQVLFEIETGHDTQKEKRPPINLAIVLDTSGSMSGDKLINCQKAVNQVIQELDKDDTLHMVSYSGSSKTIFEKGNLGYKSELSKKVYELQSGGGTVISSGLTLGNTLCKRNTNKQTASNRLFLFSDGQDNGGTKVHESLFNLASEFHKGGVNTSTFGIGEGFDETLMRGVAESGAGDYFYIDKPESIQSLVRKGLSSVLSLIGINATMKLRGRGSAVVKKAYGHPTTVLVPGVPLGDIKESDIVQLLVEIEVTPQAGKDQELLTWELSMTSVDHHVKEPLLFTGTISIPTSDDEKSNAEEDERVAVSFALFQMSEADEVAAALMGQGEREKAAKVKSNAIVSLARVEKSDHSGMVTSAMDNAKALLTQMESSSSSSASVQKSLGYQGYQNKKQAKSAYTSFGQ